MTSQVEPPTEVESTQVGRRPRYSATSTGASVPRPADAKPSTTSRPRPESARARRAACACSAYGVTSSTRPQSERATPTIATFRLTGPPISPVRPFAAWPFVVDSA